MSVLSRIWAAILPAREVRVIPWPGWDDADEAPPVWLIDDWTVRGFVPLQHGVRGIVAERRIPRAERVARWIRNGIRSATAPAPQAAAPTDGAARESEYHDDVRVRSQIPGLVEDRSAG